MLVAVYAPDESRARPHYLTIVKNPRRAVRGAIEGYRDE